MEHISSIISLLFFLGALVSLCWGIQIIRMNSKSSMNRIFLLICIAASIWNFGFSMANSVNSLDNALLWRRFAAIGMTSIFSIVLHFMLLLTRQNEDKKLNKILYLLYIPGLICMYIFSFSFNMATVQHDLVMTDYGLTNIAENSVWNYFYYSYYLLYMGYASLAIWKWRKKLDNKMKARQANFIIVGILLALLLGSLTDIVVSTFSENPLPQMAPLFVLMPVWAMYYAAKYHDILTIKRTKKEELILSSKQERFIFIALSIGISLGGILSFAFEFFSTDSGNGGDLKGSLSKAGILIILGLSIFFIQGIKSESLKEKLTTIVLVASVPVVTFQFFKYSTITVWAYSMVIIMSSLLFNKRVLLISTTLVALITQRVVWIFRQESYVLVDKYDFILRMLLLIAAFFLGSYINKIYLSKIKENNYQMEFQKLVSSTTLDLVGFCEENSYDKLNSLLEKTGKFFNVDRTYIFTINHNNDTMTYSNEWCDIGIDKEVGTIEEIPIETFPWWIDQLESEKRVYIKDVNYMPKEANAEQEQLRRQEVKSLISLPVTREGETHAFVGMDSVLETKSWSEEDIELLNIIANILANVLTPVQIDKETKFKAYNDSLTKLPNRFLFADRVNQAISLSKRTGGFIAIVFIDLDGFKAVNDTIGHRGGDQLLKQVAKNLSEVIRKTDTVARFGGDEFLIMINNIRDYDEIPKIADKIMKVFSDAFTVDGQEFLVTASAGVAIYPSDGEDSETLVKNADTAMYKAKSQGKNQYAISNKEMKDEMEINSELSNDISKALERNELIVYYQPQIDLLTNKITGVEALIRWMHPTRGMISPGIFIPIAEKNNLINSIGEWVLRTACEQIKKWQDMGLAHLEIAVNLSAVQIINPKTIDNIENIIKETRIDPKYIELEITESIAIKETDYVLNVLNKLKKLGVSIAIDDFGTEYSSLTRLKVLPVDRIKIDMQFVQGIESNEKDKAIIMVIINLAHKLGLSVLAEGVETIAQLDFLVQEKCDTAQGNYYYKPMSAEKMEEVLIELSIADGGKTHKYLSLNPTTES